LRRAKKSVIRTCKRYAFFSRTTVVSSLFITSTKMQMLFHGLQIKIYEMDFITKDTFASLLISLIATRKRFLKSQEITYCVHWIKFREEVLCYQIALRTLKLAECKKRKIYSALLILYIVHLHFYYNGRLVIPFCPLDVASDIVLRKARCAAFPSRLLFEKLYFNRAILSANSRFTLRGFAPDSYSWQNKVAKGQNIKSRNVRRVREWSLATNRNVRTW